MIRALASLALLALAACQGVMEAEPRLDESRQEGISLTLSASPARISPGDTARLTARLTNHTPLPARLDFSSGCQILFYVENAAGKVVVPGGGGWGCAAVLTSLELAPGETKTRVHAWTGQTSHYEPGTTKVTFRPLPAGSYRAYATLNGRLGERQIALRTTPETIELR
jgi:hypothetical protein